MNTKPKHPWVYSPIEQMIQENAQIKADKAELVAALKPFMEGTEWVTGEQFAIARALIAKHALEVSKAPRYGAEPHTVVVDDPHKEKGNQ